MREGTYRKTEAGRDEIRDRGRKLPPALRTVLLMTDGQRSLAELREVAAGVKAPADALERLLAEGLIEPLNKGLDVAGLVKAAAPVASAPPPAATVAPAGEVAVATTDAGRYVRMYERMSEAVRAHLGLRGYFLQLKIERCTDAASLHAMLPELRQALAKSKGEAFASQWEQDALADPA